ncbi:T9SS type A sorting domain-containing protein [Hymenobacter sp. 15J16-1T3B]|uniref:PKD-like domain-containing protein n=1 Tax=Hymenobacter sp. 15J16-1T3B TaxID=2886941 RepID=UPI001D10B342|nr:PKD-like domain-containing protein [Hymenobacter sp. 15J16-1T3B]MCC3160756.1 T9SS type A sorting domain-containing protein [Hymenobacter sp. 15J16-1T3B]
MKNVFHSHTGHARPATWLLLVLAAWCWAAPAARAQDPGRGGTQAGFEVDAQFQSGSIPGFWTGSGGNQNYFPTVTTYGDDWSKGATGTGVAVLKQVGGVSVPGTSPDGRALWQVDGNWGTSSTVAELSTFAGSSNKNGDNIAAGQSPYTTQIGSGGPQKNDITNTYLHSRVVNGNTWLFFGAETRSVNGASYLDFEYNQKGVQVINSRLTGNGLTNGRTVNDFLLVINYTGGGNKPVVGLRIWQSDGTWSAEQPLSSTNQFMSTNSADVAPVAPNLSFNTDGAYANVTGALQLVEGGINLSSIPQLAVLNQCAPLATVTVKTRSSPSYTSELKDFDILNFSLAPTPTAAVTAVPAQCQGANNTTTFQVSGTYAGGTAAWSATGGTVSNAQYAGGTTTATVTVTGVTTATVTLTTTSSVSGTTCSTATASRSLVVKPNPTTDAISPRTHCTGDAGAAINFTSSVSGASFSWTSTANVGFGTSGTNVTSIPAYTAANSTTAPIVATVTVTATADGCTGAPRTFTVTVNPNPATNAVTPRTHCAGESGAAISFGSPVSGASFSWSSTADVGFGTSGTNVTSIAAYTAANATSAPIVATVTVTATANGCTGAPRTFTVTVNPLPATNAVTPRTHCAGDAGAAIAFSSPVSGATFAWSSTADVGFGTSGSGVTSIAAYTAANSTTAPVVATITVTATANGCTGAPRTFTVTVNPLPATNAITPRTHCPGEQAGAISFSSPVSGASFSWTSTANVGFGTSGTNVTSIPAYTAVNATGASVVATVTVTATANGCTGAPRTFTVTVNPVAAAPSVTYNPPSCSSTTFSVTVNNPVTGTYTLTRSGYAPIVLTRLATDPAGQVLEFTGLAAGSGYSVAYTNPSGCTSASNDCVSAARPAGQSPQQPALQQRSIRTEAYPNPTTMDATINFSVPKSGHVVVQAYDALGRPVATLFDGQVPADETKSVTLKGGTLPSGTYYYRVSADGQTKTNSISLVK